MAQRRNWFLPGEKQEVEKDLARSHKQIRVPSFLPPAIRQQSRRFQLGDPGRDLPNSKSLSGKCVFIAYERFAVG